MSPRSVCHYDDEYGMIEILPIANWEHCVGQLRESTAFAEEHTPQEGPGWTDVYRLPAAPASLSALALPFDTVAESLALSLEAFDEVGEVQVGPSPVRSDGTHAFGVDAGCVVYLSPDSHRAVEDIWLGLNGPPAAAQAALLSAFARLATFADLLLVDWGWDRLYRLDDADGLAQYLREREQRFS